MHRWLDQLFLYFNFFLFLCCTQCTILTINIKVEVGYSIYRHLHEAPQQFYSLSSGSWLDQLSIQSIQHYATSCLELSVFSYKKFRYHHHFQGTSENWTVCCCNISSALSVSNSNSRQTMPPINVFDIGIDIVVDNANDDCVWTGMQSVCRSRVSQCTECSVTRTLIRHHHCYHHHWLWATQRKWMLETLSTVGSMSALMSGTRDFSWLCQTVASPLDHRIWTTACPISSLSTSMLYIHGRNGSVFIFIVPSLTRAYT